MLYVMVGLLTLALTVIAERTLVLRSLTRLGEALTHALEQLSAQDRAGLEWVCETRAVKVTKGERSEFIRSPRLQAAELLGCAGCESSLKSRPFVTRRLLVAIPAV
jgi:biopolymer transport protein ExbB